MAGEDEPPPLVKDPPPPLKEDGPFVPSFERMLHLGLELVGFTKKQISGVRLKKNLSRFRTHFNYNPLVHQILFRELQTTKNEEAHIGRFFEKVGKAS